MALDACFNMAMEDQLHNFSSWQLSAEYRWKLDCQHMSLGCACFRLGLCQWLSASQDIQQIIKLCIYSADVDDGPEL